MRYLDVSRARELIGFEARMPPDEGLRRTVESFRSSGAARGADGGFLPAIGLAENADLLRKLIRAQSRRVDHAPPVPSGPFARTSPQVAGELTGARPDDAQWDSPARLPHGQLQVAVIGDHDRRVNFLLKNVQQQMGADVDIGPLLLLVETGNHEGCVRQILARGRVLGSLAPETRAVR